MFFFLYFSTYIYYSISIENKFVQEKFVLFTITVNLFMSGEIFL